MKHISIILMWFLLISSSCKRYYGHSSITVKNNENKPIVLSIVGSGLDTIECVNQSFKIRNSGVPYDFNPGEKRDDLLNVYNTDWETNFANSSYPKIYLYFFDKDTFYNYPCDTFKKYKWYEKRELTLDYLNKNNWTITYP